jgi:putative oxidoreductase
MNIHRYAHIHDRFFNLFTYLTSLLLLVVRWNWGTLLMKAGADKMAAPDRFVAFFEGLAIPFPTASVHLVSHVEYYLGALLVIGFASRLSAIPLLITMITAMGTAHYSAIQQSFPAINPMTWSIAPIAGESAFSYILMLLFILILGPGKFSVDGLIKGIRAKFF